MLEVVYQIVNTEDAKNRKFYITSILESVLVQRPFTKHLVLALFENAITEDIDTAKLARECLKNLTSEDLSQLFHFAYQDMFQYEKTYSNIYGENKEHELAKILLRFGNEGKPEYVQARDVLE